MNVAIGMLLDQLGIARQVTQSVVADRRIGFDVRHNTRVWASPAGEVRTYQPPRIRVNVDHGNAVVGEVAHLHRTRQNKLYAVAVLPGDEVDPDRLPTFYFSVETDMKRDGTDVILTGIGLVERSAQTGLQPIKILPGSVRDNRTNRQLTEPERDIMAAAAETIRFRKDDQAPLVVYDEADAKLIGRSANTTTAWAQMARQQDELGKTYMRAPLEYRPSTILRVNR